MKTYHCDHCQHLVFFENTQCVQCEHLLAYLPDLKIVASLDETETPGVWASPLPKIAGRKYRLCGNYTEHQVCNWAIPDSDPHPLCGSCRLTRTIPNLSLPGTQEAWYVLEVAKRRLVHTLLNLGLPVANRTEDPKAGLVFDFLADPADGGPKVLTGHAEGVITINIAEANDAEREKRRLQMGEPYRTLLGHFRHEVGHYYWDRLIRDSESVDAFRERFGDERESYAEALRRHYQGGAPADWNERFISTYASSHPWEDWAESWAHYLHMADTLETAAACGMRLRPRRSDEPEMVLPRDAESVTDDFDAMIGNWFPLTYALNNLNRGMGLADAYPFVLSTPVIDKLRFIHGVIHADQPAAQVAPRVASTPPAARPAAELARS